jgi:hypothetical protein
MIIIFQALAVNHVPGLLLPAKTVAPADGGGKIRDIKNVACIFRIPKSISYSPKYRLKGNPEQSAAV